jgi:hypothetical protein
MYSNFYSNVCMFLGSLKRGVVQRHPCVTFPISKVGLDLARILHNLGIVGSYQCFQNTKRVHNNHYKHWPAGTEPATTADLQRVPHMYLRLNINYDKFHPRYVPEQASPSEFNRSFFSALPEEVKLLSSTRRQRVASWKDIVMERQNHAPGIFLVSSDRGAPAAVAHADVAEPQGPFTAAPYRCRANRTALLRCAARCVTLWCRCLCTDCRRRPRCCPLPAPRTI